MVLGLAIHQPPLLFATLGAIFLAFTEFQLPTISLRILVVACFAEAAAFGLGTIVATTNHPLSTLMLGIGVFTALTARQRTNWAPVGTITAMIFAVGVGLPGYSIQAAGMRALFSLAGTLWGLLGVVVHRFIVSQRIKPSELVSESGSRTGAGISRSIGATEEQLPPWSDVWRNALLIGIASALGYAIGLAIGLPRDFWIVVTIIFAVRPNISQTTTFTSMRVIGTILGALVAAVITLGTDNLYVLLVMLFFFIVGVFATRGVNVMLMQIFLVPYVIILLNIYYPGEWYLSLIRILDVSIGGAIAVSTVYLLGSLNLIIHPRKRNP
jgi:hypothetical protein